MEDLLTTKQVQELLKVDRTTVYRMLKDGRLTGIKVGRQWRFPRQEVEALLSGVRLTEARRATVISPDVLPLHCVQAIQDVFAELAGIGSVTTAPSGEPLTEISNSCAFCNLILGSETGRRGCIASWRRLAEQPEKHPQFVTCHAGLQYARARIELDGELTAMLIAGQFYAAPPDPEEEALRIRRLAEAYGLDRQALAEAAPELPVLDGRKQEQIGGWLERVAHTFEEIGRERAELIGRLQRIAAMSSLEL